MSFEVNEKVILFDPESRHHGRLARVCKPLNNDFIKIEIIGEGFRWFNSEFLRKTRQDAPFNPDVKENDIVKITDIKGSYADHNFIGMCGMVSLVENGIIIVDFGHKGTQYFENGDFKIVPDKKTAWVVHPTGIKRTNVQFSHYSNAQVVWTDGSYIFNDAFVFDWITPALEKANSLNKDSIKVKT